MRTCARCSQPIPPNVRGGRNDMGNIVPCCRLCNADKGDQTLTEWAAERVRLGKPPRRYSLPFTDPRFKHLTLGEATGTSFRNVSSTCRMNDVGGLHMGAKNVHRG